VSHDLAVVSELCDDIGVMYAGQLVETGRVTEVIADPRHAYTRLLVRSAPTLRTGSADRTERAALRALLNV